MTLRMVTAMLESEIPPDELGKKRSPTGLGIPARGSVDRKGGIGIRGLLGLRKK